MPFFIPVEYYDTRIQFNDNVSSLRGAHSIKAGVEYNRVELGPDLPRLRERPLHLQLDRRLPELRAQSELRRVLERHHRRRPAPARQAPRSTARAAVSAAGRRRQHLASRKRGRRSIPQTEPAVFIQDAWQATPNLNVQYGLRWEAQIQPDPITPAGRGLLRAVHRHRRAAAQDVPVGRRDPVRLRACGSRASASRGTRAATARRCLRAQRRHLLRPHPRPGPRVVALHQRQPRPDALPQQRADDVLGPVPAYPNLIRTQVGAPFRPDVFVFDEDFQNPRTTAARASAGSRRSIQDYAVPRQVQLRQGRRTSRASSTATTRFSARPVVARGPRTARHRRQRHRRADGRRVDARRASITA